MHQHTVYHTAVCCHFWYVSCPDKNIMVTTLSFKISFQCLLNHKRIVFSFYMCKRIFVCSVSFMQVYLQCKIILLLARLLVSIHLHMWISNLTTTTTTENDDNEEKKNGSIKLCLLISCDQFVEWVGTTWKLPNKLDLQHHASTITSCQLSNFSTSGTLRTNNIKI